MLFAKVIRPPWHRIGEHGRTSLRGAELTAYTLRAPDGIIRGAAKHGPAVAEFAQRLFDGPPAMGKGSPGHKLIRLGQRYTPQRLDDACRKTLAVDLIDGRRVEISSNSSSQTHRFRWVLHAMRTTSDVTGVQPQEEARGARARRGYERGGQGVQADLPALPGGSGLVRQRSWMPRVRTGWSRSDWTTRRSG